MVGGVVHAGSGPGEQATSADPARWQTPHAQDVPRPETGELVTVGSAIEVASAEQPVGRTTRSPFPGCEVDFRQIADAADHGAASRAEPATHEQRVRAALVARQ